MKTGDILPWSEVSRIGLDIIEAIFEVSVEIEGLKLGERKE